LFTTSRSLISENPFHQCYQRLAFALPDHTRLRPIADAFRYILLFTTSRSLISENPFNQRYQQLAFALPIAAVFVPSQTFSSTFFFCTSRSPISENPFNQRYQR
jgi:hypothetical protein